MAQTKFYTKDFTSGSTLPSADLDTIYSDTQAEFNLRLRKSFPHWLADSTSFTGAINGANVDFTAGSGAYANGKYFGANGSIAFSGADANGTYKLYLDGADSPEGLAKTTGTLPSTALYLADVTWANPTLSALTDKRTLFGPRASQYVNRMALGGFRTYDMPGSTTARQLYLHYLDLIDIVMPYPGAIVAIGVSANIACTGGTATFEIYKNGVGTGLTCQLNVTNVLRAYATQVVTADTFIASDALSIWVTTSAFAPAAIVDAHAFIWVEM